MGGWMARRLAAAGHKVTCFDLNADAVAETVAAGARAGASATECAATADLFLTSLPRPDHVEAVMSGEEGALAALRPGSIWVDLTTNRKELVQAYAAAAPEGVSVVDSPVTGAVDGARNGKDVGELHVAKQIEDDAQPSFRLEGGWTPPWEQ